MATSPTGGVDAKARAFKLLRHPLIVVPVILLIGFWLMSRHFEANRIAYENSPEGRAEVTKQADQAAIDLAQSLVAVQLRDPSSAEFLGTKVVRQGGHEVVCGLVNGRNGFGGKAGYQTFAAIDGVVILAQGGKAFQRANAFCRFDQPN